MAILESSPQAPPDVTVSATPPRLLVSLPSLAPDALDQLAAKLHTALPSTQLTIATPDASFTHGHLPAQDLIPQGAADPSGGSWHLTAADFLNARDQLVRHPADAILLLGAESQTLAPEGLAALAQAVLQTTTDLAVARYDLPPRSGLVTSAILYPLSRALFAAPPRFPLALDLCLSPRMAERLSTVAARLLNGNQPAAAQPDAFVWPIAEAAVAGFSIEQIPAGHRTLPQPDSPDLNALLGAVASSLFTEIDQKAAFWQRARSVPRPTALPASTHPPAFSPDDVQPMLDTFRSAYGNLHEIWSLVLPPQTLLGLKRLSTAAPDSFRMPDSLWARIVYDFLLAFRLRTINRNHLLGALTPLYLAWVASHILITSHGEGAAAEAERHVEAQAAAFEADKPYLVSRWRWPDRFNP